MKLATFSTADNPSPRLGVVSDGGVVDLSSVAGTPAGVGAAMQPPQFLKAGDLVRIEIEKLGHLEGRVVQERAECMIE